MAYFIKPIEEERCGSFSFKGEIRPRETAVQTLPPPPRRDLRYSMRNATGDGCQT